MSVITLTGDASEREAWSAVRCSMDAALKIIGRRATLLLLREAFYGTHRFEDFARRAGFTDAVTATRLRELVAEGLLERRPYQDPGQRRRQEYHLTEKGRDLYPAIVALRQWGDKWAQPDGPPVDFTHAGCGAPTLAEVQCTKGHHVAVGEVEARVTRIPPHRRD